MAGQPERRSFSAMGTTIELTVWGVKALHGDQLCTELESRAERWEQIFSRFRDDSELNHVNRHAGNWTRVSNEFIAITSAAQNWFTVTAGRFDPAILESLERAGYDRTFDEIDRSGASIAAAPTRRSRWSQTVLDIEFDRTANAIRMPAGMRIDLGGIAKGAFVDSVNDIFQDLPGAIVDAGGDLRLWGRPGHECVWRIGVQDPGSLQTDIAELRLWAGRPLAVATSSTRSRNWSTGTERQNHLIDPQTGRAVPFSTPSVTVVAGTVVAAEVLAKATLISLARGEHLPGPAADLVLIAYEDGHYETIPVPARAA